jgi:hypothetical protein
LNRLRVFLFRIVCSYFGFEKKNKGKIIQLMQATRANNCCQAAGCHPLSKDLRGPKKALDRITICLAFHFLYQRALRVLGSVGETTEF